MTIVSLEVENVKRIRAARIDPKGNVVVLEGKNEQGKTSVLDAIQMALEDKRVQPKRPVRDGADSAHVILQTEEFTVTRNWTSDTNSYVKITAQEDGHTIGSPQAFLSGLLGKLAFDPLACESWDSAKRLEMLRRVAGIDTTRTDALIEKAFGERKDIKRDLDAAKKELAGLGEVPKIAKVRAIEEVQVDYDREKKLCDQVDANVAAIPEVEAEVKEAEEALEAAKQTLAGKQAKLRVIQGCAAKAKPDMTAIIAELNAARDAGSAAFKIERRNELQAKIDRFASSLHERECTLKSARDEKVRAIEEAKMPLDGLGLADGDVTYKGCEFSELSQAEKVRVALGMAMAENPKLRIVRITNGSLLDDDSMAEVHRMAAEHQYQVWIERVANGPSGEGNAVYIEDGETVDGAH